jgi:hypothetical protein
MSVRRYIEGKRADGTNGVFVSPAGIDAFYATNDQLLLNISDKISQLLLLSFVDSSQVVALGLAVAPIVLITSQGSLAGISGYESVVGPSRPSPMGFGNNAAGSVSYATVNGNGTSLSLNVFGRTQFSVYSRAL